MDNLNINIKEKTLDEPLYGFSQLHWNIIPEDLKNETQENILIFINGWESYYYYRMINPHQDIEKIEIWNRGFWAAENNNLKKNEL